jgi:hypothetical protein
MSRDDHKNSNSVLRLGGAMPWRAAAVACALAATALLAAACGSGGSHAAGSGPSSGQNFAAELDSFASCVRSHGVPGFYFTTATPSPPPDGEVFGDHGYNVAFDPSSPAFKAAFQACQHLAPFSLNPPHASHQQFLKELKSAECMRSHGYPDWPDPNPAKLGFRVPVSIDTSSTQFQAAAKTCGLPPGV